MPSNKCILSFAEYYSPKIRVNFFKNHGVNRGIIHHARGISSDTVVENAMYARVNDRNRVFTRASFRTLPVTSCQIIRPHPQSLSLGPFVIPTRKVRLLENKSALTSDREEFSFTHDSDFLFGPSHCLRTQRSLTTRIEECTAQPCDTDRVRTHAGQEVITTESYIILRNCGSFGGEHF